MLFRVHARDRAGALDVRMANRQAHIDWLKARGDDVRAAGPWFNDAGEMAGSLLIVEAADRVALDVWLATDPYARAGLFEAVEIAPYKWAINPPANSAALRRA